MKDPSATYISKEEAEERQPLEIYHIWRDGAVGTTHWYYTSGSVSIEYGGNTYIPVPISRGNIAYDSDINVSTLTINTNALSDISIEHIALNPVEMLWVSISKIFLDQDPYEGIVLFIGQIKSVVFQGNSAQIKCVGFEHFLKQPIPIYRYQATCNHNLYSTGCGLDKNTYKTTAVITLSSDGKTLTSSSFGAEDDGYFIRGYIEFEDAKRMIIAHSGNDITISFPILDLEDSDTVYAYAGCDKFIETCKNKFDNLDNFLGMPFIPYDNPATRVP